MPLDHIWVLKDLSIDNIEFDSHDKEHIGNSLNDEHGGTKTKTYTCFCHGQENTINRKPGFVSVLRAM